MTVPDTEAYNAVVQNPSVAFSNAGLRMGSVDTNALGLPKVFSGGFALTYSMRVNGRRFALRCFHRDVPGLNQRYQEISDVLRRTRLSYFVRFAFLPDGIRVDGAAFPIVLMEWAEGDILGEHLFRAAADQARISSLQAGFRTMAAALEAAGIAHGDLANQNIIIVDGDIKLVDYDGMYVPGMQEKQASETGNRFFQHPLRDSNFFGPELDRFSLIAIDLSLEALKQDGGLYHRFSEGGETILFRPNDFLDPDGSEIFDELRSRPKLKPLAARFARICRADVRAVPSLGDYLAGRNIPAARRRPTPVSGPRTSAGATTTDGRTAYVSAFPVLDAADYAQGLTLVGQRTELVGRIVTVKTGFSPRQHKGPYVFVNFGDWRGKTIKLNIWAEALPLFEGSPASAWVDKWVVVTGLLEPPYDSPKFGYSHLSITLNSPNELRFVTEEEARYRLTAKKRKRRRSVETVTVPSAGEGDASSTDAPPVLASPRSRNQEVVERIRESTPARGLVMATPAWALPLPAPEPTLPRIAARIAMRRLPWWVWVIGGLVLLGSC